MVAAQGGTASCLLILDNEYNIVSNHVKILIPWVLETI